MAASSGSRSSLEELAKDTVKELAPWRSGLAWWIILIEGIVVALAGLLMILTPRGTNRNIALFLTGALAVAGLLQLWTLLRARTPEHVDTLVSARAAVAVFAGLIVLDLFFWGHLTWQVGLITVGTASLVYGLLGLVLIYRWKGARRQNAIIETTFFVIVGLLMLYAQVGSAGSVETAIQVLAWLSLLTGLGLVGFAFFRRSKDEEYRAAVEKVSGMVGARQKKLDEEQ